MPGVWYRFRAELRARWRAWLGLALIIGAVGGIVLGLIAGARRTDSAYQRFLKAQNAYDVIVSLNQSGFGASTEETFDREEIEALPEVADTARTGSFFVTLGAGVGVLVPPNERIGSEINKFKMLEGRRPDPADPTEVVIGFELARQYDLDVGSSIEVIDPFFFGPPPPDAPPDEVAEVVAARDQVLAVLPDNQLTVVGIEASPGEFPPQIEGTGRYLIHASPALYPLRADLGVLSEGSDQLMVRLNRGERDTDAFVEHLRQLGAGEGVQLTVQRDLAEVVDRSLHTQTVALQLLALLTAIAGGLIISQLLARLTFLESAEHPILSAVGMTRGQRVTLGLARAAAIGAGAALLALPLTVAISPLFPTGLARTAEPAPGVRVDALVLVAGALAVIGGVVLLSAWAAWRVTRSATRTASEPLPARPSLAGRIVAGGAPVPVGTGVRMALEPGRGGSAVPVRTSLAGVTLGIATLVAAITFGASLAHLLATPDLYGQTWDVEVTTYDETLPSGVSVLEGDDRIVGVAAGDFRTLLEIDGRRVDGLVLETVKGDLAPVILEGRRPEGGDEIALGTRTLRRFGIAVGDRVAVAPFAEDRDPVAMEVVGRSVFPVFSEAGRLGDGAFVGPDGWERISGAPVDASDSSLLLRLAPGAAVDAVVGDLEAEFETTIFVINQGKPTDIVNFGRVEVTPYVLGAILAVISVATLVHLLLSAVRRRRRELAILKTLGFVRGQVRGAVAWQATTLVVVALVVGVPLGVATGRWAWTQFADELGVVPVPEVPLLAIAALVPIAVLVANAVAALPAAMAASTRPAQLLRSE